MGMRYYDQLSQADNTGRRLVILPSHLLIHLLDNSTLPADVLDRYAAEAVRQLEGQKSGDWEIEIVKEPH